MRLRRPGALAAGALLLVAVGCFVASFLVRPALGALLVSGREGPVAAAPGQARRLAMPSWLGGAPSTGTMAVHFAFVDDRLRPGQVVLRAGTSSSGLRVSVERDVGTATYLALRLAPWPDHPLEAPLVPRLVDGRRYEVRIALRDMQTVTAWVDGAEVASYRASQPTVGTVFRPLVAGGRTPAGAGGRAPGPAVSGVTLSYRVRALSGSGTGAAALLTVAGMAGLGLVFVVAMGLLSGDDEAPGRRLVRRVRAVVPLLARRAGLVGVVLLVAGGALVELVTPPADAVGRQSGVEHLALASVAPGASVLELHVGSPRAQASAASVDETLRFELRLGRRPRRVGAPLVTTWVHGTGISVNVGPRHSLIAAVRTFAVQGGGIPLQQHLQLHRWSRIEVRVVRSREIEAFVDGAQVFAFTYASPIWGPAPTGLEVRAPGDRLAVRDLSATTVLFSRPDTGSTLLLVRLGQVLGFLLVAGGAVVLAARFLRRLVPVARPARPLVRAAFGVAAVGIAVNLLVDALHVQHPPAPFAPRNTWLFAADARFADFLQTFALLLSRNPYGPAAGSYPPAGYFLVAPFAPMSQFAALICFLALFAGAFGWWLWRSFSAGRTVEAVLVVAVAFASYPVSFAIDRANVDLLVALLVIVAVAAVEQGRDRLAAGLIGIAAAAKVVPGLYVLLFVRPLRRWRYALGAALTAAVATLACFLGLAGSLASNIAGFRRGLHIVQLLYANGVQSTLASVTVSSWAQSIAYAIGGVSAAQATEAVMHRIVLPEEVVGALALAWYLWRRERSPWRAVTLVTVAMLVLPQVSYAYELVYVFVPLALFVREARPSPATVRIAVLFGLLLAPKSYLYFGSSFIDSSTLFNAPLLVALAVAVVREGRGERAPAADELAGGDEVVLAGAAPDAAALVGHVEGAVGLDRRGSARPSGLRSRRPR